ncbi:effector-associated constant component EACC1 [Nocardia sp. BMG111209]|uniref:effector-associated constant component EACC1 n=1 Tax=Nocardia sp. BMG111209 TaxID=1160137 RepID=UPI000368DC74|nr:hypothetical protein [Nocardia sp. BMG111209]
MTIGVEGGPDEVLALLDWFGHDDVLRGRVRPVAAGAGAGQMSGGVYEAIGVALGAGGVASALVRSLTAWVTHRRSDVKLTFTRGDTTVEFDGARVDPEEVLRELRSLLEPPGGAAQ